MPLLTGKIIVITNINWYELLIHVELFYYRDMKSTNVYVKEKTGKCVIGDLGVAMILEPSLDIGQLTITKQV